MMSEQFIFEIGDSKQCLDEYLENSRIKKIFLVNNSSLERLELNNYFCTLEKRLGIQVVRFRNYEPNPTYESVVEGVELFRKENCDLIIAVGGGSAMDVAKSIKLFSNMNAKENYLKQEIVPNSVKFIAMPTTAGTGSEATRYAVIYYHGEKCSISDESCIPEAVFMDASALRTLPIYQKKATMMDAFCHAIESFWSINSTNESKEYSKQAICMILENKSTYLSNDMQSNKNMLYAAHIAGKAINITQTTAGHAMCYKLTSLYGIAHGHAAAICTEKIWAYMIANVDKCIDLRGTEYLKKIFSDIAYAMGCSDIYSALELFQQVIRELELEHPHITDIAEYVVLKKSVNRERLKNNPVDLSEEAIDGLYHQIVGKERI